MLDTVVFDESWRNIKVSAHTDLYAYDPEDGALLFISLAGNEQAVKAISSAIIAHKTVSIRREGEPERLLNGNPAPRYRIMSTKLAGGPLHQIVADARFYLNNESDSRLVIIPAETPVHEVIYNQVLVNLASPLIPAWAQWVCDRLQQMDRVRDMAGTLRVTEVSVNESTIDEIVSGGIRNGQINFNGQGGAYAGVHQRRDRLSPGFRRDSSPEDPNRSPAPLSTWS
ncbi:MAG: hypothetical protein FJY85_06025 [Deltaproteobacteria bacterium]|nr:hypothetical protein [Deltaproteobacteria bacterium]